METKRITTEEQLEEAYRIRKAVFVKEQGVPEEAELDEYDDVADHVLVYFENEAVGTGRVRIVDDMAKLERICVLSTHRKHRLGQAIMEELEAIAIEKGVAKAKLHGQVQAAPFYEKQGYEIASTVFMEEDIPHVKMIKDL
ncbi:GNAT family N-acetyltransferase [Paenibacillus sp. FSL H8-0548]|uniref:GNAT family N-acetyltransferase n=1 Tax=Paenibacillus sp. FSL H8-0548 TaxID=1920422 RepID=UPI00096CA54F|nr:GNAT family N-acetyltransferase [Paenibacillus sp. FSL H8-0548]OMF38353.1 GNAT family N-acetyltransferase [Paenibacillus sp. FSL H8-0548]